MRVVIVGVAEDRQRLKALLPEGVDVVAEVRTVREARRVVGIDAILTPASPGSSAPVAGDDAREAIEPLTARELEVLTLLSRGLPNKSIAAALGISDQTVKFHVATIFGKLGASNRTDAARRALRFGLIPL
jgi:DNA-binding NarL/FixJ family response regulator